jgi:hypothetical protein
MISRKLWITVRRTKSRLGYVGQTTKWQVEREGWFLFGVIPLFVRDLRVTEI